MSHPNMPDIKPELTVTKKEAVSLLLSSIAMEELALAHLIQAEADKILVFADLVKKGGCSVSDCLKIHSDAAHFMETIVIKQWLALNRLDRIMQLAEKDYSEENSDWDDEE